MAFGPSATVPGLGYRVEGLGFRVSTVSACCVSSELVHPFHKVVGGGVSCCCYVMLG